MLLVRFDRRGPTTTTAAATKRITRIVLCSRITMVAPANEDRVRHLVGVAHRECYGANSLKTAVEADPTIIVGSTLPGRAAQ